MVKFYFSSMRGATSLNSEWGSLLEVLKSCLITGFNEQVIGSISTDNNVATVALSTGHGFLPHQVVALTNAGVFSGEHRLMGVTANTVSFNTDVVGTHHGGTIKTASCGWTEKFTGDKKAIFEPKDKIKNPFLLRVDNSIPDGYDATWAKFARVTLLENANSIDDFVGFAKAPQTNGDNINELGNGVTGANGIYGWAKWYHGVRTENYLYEASGNGQGQARDWVIVADDCSLYFLPQITDMAGRAEYAFCAVNAISGTDKWAGFLSATEHKRRANENGFYYADGRNSIGSCWKSNAYRGKFLLRNHTGTDSGSVSCALLSLNMNNNEQVSGRSANVEFPNVGNYVLLHDIYVKDSSNHIRGTLPMVKWIHQRWGLDKRIINHANHQYLFVGTDYNNEGMTAFLAFDLEAS